MRVPIKWGAPAGLLLVAITTPGCATYYSASDGFYSWMDSVLWKEPPAPERPPPAAVRPDADSYVVRPGDTLGEIAFFYGIPIEALARANGILDANELSVGERLVIPHDAATQVAARQVAAAPPARSRALVRRAAARPAQEVKRAALDVQLHNADELVRTARFDEALAETERARPALAELEATSGRDAERRVRLEVLSATASIALGRDEAAHQSFERALRADADLELDPASTSPKVVRHLEETRRRLAAAPANAAENVAEGSAAP